MLLLPLKYGIDQTVEGWLFSDRNLLHPQKLSQEVPIVLLASLLDVALPEIGLQTTKESFSAICADQNVFAEDLFSSAELSLAVIDGPVYKPRVGLG